MLHLEPFMATFFLYIMIPLLHILIPSCLDAGKVEQHLLLCRWRDVCKFLQLGDDLGDAVRQRLDGAVHRHLWARWLFVGIRNAGEVRDLADLDGAELVLLAPRVRRVDRHRPECVLDRHPLLRAGDPKWMISGSAGRTWR